MLKLTKNIYVSAPPDKVFDVMDDNVNLPEIWHNLSNVRNVRRIPNGGQRFEFDYNMAGLTMHGISVDLEFIRPSRLKTHTSGGIQSTLTWEFNPGPDNGTDLVCTIEYEVPLPLIGNLAEMMIAKVNDTDIVYVLNYLKLKFA